MEINLTLIVQMLVFAAFVWFTMKFVWPPLMNAMEARQEKIAEGLAAAERGHRELELSQHRAKDELKLAKTQAAELVEKAQRRAAQIVADAQADAQQEADMITKAAREQIGQEMNRAKDALRKQVAALAIAGAEKILQREIDEKVNHALIDNLIEEI